MGSVLGLLFLVGLVAVVWALIGIEIDVRIDKKDIKEG